MTWQLPVPVLCPAHTGQAGRQTDTYRHTHTTQSYACTRTSAYTHTHTQGRAINLWQGLPLCQAGSAVQISSNPAWAEPCGPHCCIWLEERWKREGGEREREKREREKREWLGDKMGEREERGRKQHCFLLFTDNTGENSPFCNLIGKRC